MMSGRELERLLEQVVSIYEDNPGRETPDEGSPEGVSTCSPPVDERWEEVIAAVLRALRRIVAAVEPRSVLPPAPASALRGALGGADLVMRSEVIAGRGDGLLELLPSFAYLTTIAFLDYAEALRGCERVRELLEAEGYTPR